MNYDLNHLPRFDAVQGNKVIYVRNGKRMERALPGKGKGKKVRSRAGDIAKTALTAAALGIGGLATGWGAYQTARYGTSKRGREEVGNAFDKTGANIGSRLEGAGHVLQKPEAHRVIKQNTNAIRALKKQTTSKVQAQILEESARTVENTMKQALKLQEEVDKQKIAHYSKESAKAVGKAFKGYGTALIGGSLSSSPKSRKSSPTPKKRKVVNMNAVIVPQRALPPGL